MHANEYRTWSSTQPRWLYMIRTRVERRHQQYHPLENSYVDSEAKKNDSDFGSLYFTKATVTGRSYSWDTWAINFGMVPPSLAWRYSIGLEFLWFTFGHFPRPHYFRPRMINIARFLNKFIPRNDNQINV